MPGTLNPWKRLPGNRPLEDEVASRGAWLVQLRWWAVAALFAGTGLARWILGPEVPWLSLDLVGVGMLFYNGLFRGTLERLRETPDPGANRLGRFVATQFVTDWFALAALVHLTGGVASPLLFFFVFHAIIASILLPPIWSYLYAGIGVAIVATLATLETTGVLPATPVPGFRGIDPTDWPSVLMAMSAFGAAVVFSNHLAGTIARRLWARTRELMRVRDELEETYLRTRTLHDIARAINSTLDLSDVLQKIVESTPKALAAKACSIRLLDDESERLCMSAAHGLSDEYLSKGDIELARSPVDREALSGRPVQLSDVAGILGFQYPEQAAREGIRSVVVAPLIARGLPIGVLRVYDTQPRVFTEEEVHYLMTMASQGAAAIENARAFRRLGELEEAKSRFVFMVVHELKAPMASIRSALTLMDEGYAGEVNPDQRRLLDRLERKLGTLQDLLRDLLALGSLRERLPAAGRGDVPLDGAVAKAVERVGGMLETKRITLTVFVEPGLSARSSEEDLDKIVGNLVDNAVKYTPENGRVRVSARREGPVAVIEVGDTGIGIPKDALPHLFQEFFRAQNARRNFEGTGLGLALVHRLVKLHKGEIEVATEEGKGTTFTVRLPSKGPAEVEPASPSAG